MATSLAVELDEIDRRLDDADWTARARAVDRAGRLLAECGDDASLQRLLRLLERGAGDDDWQVREATALALRRAGDPRGAALIDRLVADYNRFVREAARSAERRTEARGAARSDPTLDQMLSVIEGVTPGRLSRNHLLRLARAFGDLHYQDLARETAHELRTVVTAVDGCLAALDDRLRDAGREDPDISEIASRLRERGRFLTRLVDDLCTYSAAPSGEMVAVPLPRVLEVAVDLARSRVGPERVRAGVTISLESEGDLVVDGLRDRLARAVANLVANAIEAISGDGTVLVRAAAGPGEAVTILVVDSGCGMDTHQSEQARGRYTTSKRAQGGTGLGLPIAIRIVEREHGGRLRLESVPGRGTTVRVELPRAQRSKVVDG